MQCGELEYNIDPLSYERNNFLRKGKIQVRKVTFRYFLFIKKKKKIFLKGIKFSRKN